MLQCWVCRVCRVCRVYWCTLSKQPPAVLLVCGTLAIVAVALGLVVARFAVHLEAVVRTVLRRSRAVFRQVAFTGRRSAHTSCLFQLQVEEKKINNNKQQTKKPRRLSRMSFNSSVYNWPVYFTPLTKPSSLSMIESRM